MIVRICAALAATLLPLSGWALESPLAVFPPETSLVLRSSSPSVLTAKAKAFLNQAAPRFAPIAERIGPAIGSLVQNPTLGGVDAERDWYLAVMLQAESQPRLVYAIPAGDIEALTEALGEEITSRAYDDWLFYSTVAEAIESLPEEAPGEDESIASAMDESATTLFAEGEMSLFVNLPSVRETYARQIEDFQAQFEKGMENPAVADNPQAQAMMKQGRQIIKTALEVLESSRDLAMNVSLREDAIVSEAIFIVEPESKTGKFLAKQKPSKLPLINQLPADSMIYADIAGGLNALVDFSAKMYQNNPSTDEKSKEAMTKLLSYDFQESAFAFSLADGEEGALRSVSMTRLDSAEGYLEDLRAWAKATPHIETEGYQQDISLKPEAETIAGISVDLVRTTFTIEPEGDPTGNLNQFMKLFVGEEGISQRVAVVDNLIVQAVGGGREQMEKALQRAKGEQAAGAGEAVAALRQELGETGQLLVIYDLPRTAAGFLSVVLESGLVPLPPNTAAAIEELDLQPSFGGTQMSIEGHRVRFREIIPAAQVKGLIDLGTALQQATQREE